MSLSEREKMARGLLYDANHNPDLIRERAVCKDMCFAYNNLKPSDEAGKRKIAERLFGRIGRDFSVVAPFYCDYGYNIFCGEDFFANHNCVMLDGARITFGDHVYIAPNCCLATAGHPLDAELRAVGLEFAREIKIGNNVWLGAGVTVLPGVTIGDNTVIGAGSIVNKDIPANVVAAGNPCRVLREINERDKQIWQEKEQACLLQKENKA